MAVRSNKEAIKAAARRGALRGLAIGANMILEEATSLILDSEKSGRTYRRRGVEHQASAPGEAPASDTGRLVQSGKVELKPDELAAEISWSTAYAQHLEFGSERTAARPFVRPALANRAADADRALLGEIAREIIGTFRK